MLIDATNTVVGRLASFAAKKALLGEQVNIINCEKAIISGSKKEVFARYQQKRDRGGPRKGPFIHRMPDRFVRRIIRGMLPMDKPRGKQAFKRVMCYIGVPEEFKGEAAETLPEFNADKLLTLKKVSVGEVCKSLGAKWYEV
ncbi:MAG TPA: 50S ribosomal protein L13 [Candidatus Woesearchaeota archaeon]|nr:50S ribosomal protein L13 [Candidatus Woesearchaeota archaeon]